MKRVRIITGLLIIYAILLALTPGVAWAGGPARSETKAAGPYVIVVNLYQDPPYTDTPSMVTVVPQDSTLQLQGHIVEQPGLGTNATPLQSNLTATGDNHGTLKGTVRMPVRGAWNIVIELTGPKGSGSATVAVTVASPGAIPTWLGWLIGTSPLLFIAWWIWKQHRYRRTLLAKQQSENASKIHIMNTKSG